MVERLLLDRVHMGRGWPTVDEAAQHALHVHPRAALARFARRDVAVLGAQQASHARRVVGTCPGRIGLALVAGGAVGAGKRGRGPVAGPGRGPQEIIAVPGHPVDEPATGCLLYTSDAADDLL